MRMSINRIIFTLLRLWWVIIIFALIGGGVGGILVNYTLPVYKATSTLYMMNIDKLRNEKEELQSSDIIFSQQLIQQYKEIIYSRAVISNVIKTTNSNLTEEQILSMVELETKQDSNVFTISVKNKDPYLAAELTNTMADTFVATILRISNSQSVGILDRAIVPVTPEVNHRSARIFLGITAGLMLAICIIYVIQFFDTKVRSEKDIIEDLNVRVIGIIPKYDIK
jgi:capsular polysaccharide biosynthesis protein